MRHYPGLWERLLCLLPFEPAFFARHGLPASFVGHPVLESGADRGDAARFRARHGIPPDARILTLMPGSRRTEVSRLLPMLGATLQRLLARSPGCARWCRWPVRSADAVRQGTARLAGPAAAGDRDRTTNTTPSPPPTAALTKSGTSTLELALAGRADAGDLPGQPDLGGSGAANGEGALCLAAEPAGRAGGGAGTDTAGLHAGPAGASAAAPAGGSGCRRGATGRILRQRCRCCARPRACRRRRRPRPCCA